MLFILDEHFYMSRFICSFDQNLPFWSFNAIFIFSFFKCFNFKMIQTKCKISSQSKGKAFDLKIRLTKSMFGENILDHLERISQNHYNIHLMWQRKNFFSKLFFISKCPIHVIDYCSSLLSKSLRSESVIAARSTMQDFSAVFLFFVSLHTLVSYHSEMAMSGLNFSISVPLSHSSVALSQSQLNILHQSFLENICSSLALEKGVMRSILKMWRTFLHSSIIF